MRIALITTWGRRCGMAVYAERLVEEWQRLGHTVWVLDEQQHVEPMRSDAPVVPYIACWQRPDPSIAVLNEIAFLEPDVCIFSHDWHEIDVEVLRRLAAGCHNLGCPLVIGWHNLVATRSSAQELREIDGHVVYNPDASAWLQKIGIDASRIIYAPHGCGSPVSLESHAIPRLRSRIATFGLMYRSKGLDNVVTTLAMVRSALPDRNITLDVFSTYNAWTQAEYINEMNAIQAYINESRLAQAVNVWAGFPSEAGLLRALGDTDVILLLYRPVPHRLSASAALPMALAAARPVVTAAIPHFQGNPSLSRARIAAHDAVEAGEAVVRLLTDEKYWLKMAHRAREYALAHTYADCAEQYIALFDRLIRNAPARRRIRLGLTLPATNLRGQEDILQAVRGFPLQMFDPEQETEASAIKRLPSDVKYVLSLQEGDRLHVGWDLMLWQAVRDSIPKTLRLIGIGGQRLCRQREMDETSSNEVVLNTDLLECSIPDQEIAGPVEIEAEN